MKLPNLSALNKPWALITMALILGIGATVLTVKYLKNKEAQVKAMLLAGKAGMAEVVVPRFDLQKGDRISYDNMSTRFMQADMITELTIRPGNFAAYVGKELSYRAQGGKPIVRAQLRFAGLKEFAQTIPEAMRALTMRVDEINSISGMLRPGDRIDMFIKTKGKTGIGIVAPLLLNAQVRATGTMVVGDPAPGSGKVSYNTVTLEVTPYNAQRLIMAQSVGKIVVVLRNPDDFEDPFLDQLKATSLLEEVLEQDTDMILYILGGSPQDGAPKIVKKPVVSGPPILQLAGAGDEGAPDLGSLEAPK